MSKIKLLIALDAVQDFSFGSNEEENPLDIDDVQIANNIAMCANEEPNIESYGYKWTWEDGEIQEQEVRIKLNDFRKRKLESFRVSVCFLFSKTMCSFISSTMLQIY